LLNILTVDLEALHHAEYVRDKRPEYIEEHAARSLDKTLALLSKHNVHGTFFIVGELLEKCPQLAERIREEGHEIAFHGYSHKRLQNLDADIFEKEISMFNSLSKERCLGFRAPSFSLNNQTIWALPVLEKKGFAYDSSIFSTATPLYGVPRAPTKPYRLSFDDVAKHDANGKLWEFPLLTLKMWGLKLPVAGGFYLRQCPERMVKKAIKLMNKQNAPAVIYVHTWEIDSETPVLKLGIYRSYVTYANIEKTKGKIESLLTSFKFTSVRDFAENAKLL
jgi:polysaccharide deacetylase family protein (PEP-CTERM system associated)